jgi:hypothetical protein
LCWPEEGTSGAKAHFILKGFMARLKPCPFEGSGVRGRLSLLEEGTSGAEARSCGDG